MNLCLLSLYLYNNKLWMFPSNIFILFLYYWNILIYNENANGFLFLFKRYIILILNRKLKVGIPHILNSFMVPNPGQEKQIKRQFQDLTIRYEL